MSSQYLAQMKVAKINFALFILGCICTSCCKDTEVLTPVKDCHITGTYSHLNKEWRFFNFDSKGDMNSFSYQSYFSYISRDKSKEIFRFVYADTEEYTRVGDTIYGKLMSDNKVFNRIVVKDNRIQRVINNYNGSDIVYTYKDLLIAKEEYYRISSKKLFLTIDYEYEDGATDVFDYYNVLGFTYQYLENRLLAGFFGLEEKYGRVKIAKMKFYNQSGVLEKEEEYQYRYFKNERGLVSYKLVDEIKQGKYKDSVSYTYTCKF